MSSLEELDDMDRENKDGDGEEMRGHGDGHGEGGPKSSTNGAPGGDAEMKDTEQNDEDEALDAEILHSSTRDVINRRKLLENEMRIMKSEFGRLSHEKNNMNEKIKDNVEKIENNRFVVANTLIKCALYSAEQRLIIFLN